MMVFGGKSNEAGPADINFNDAWVLTNADGLGGAAAWVELAPTGPPPSKRHMHTAVFDPGSNRLVVFGGHADEPAGETFVNDLWVLRDANGLGGTPEWIKLSPVGTKPAVREWHSAVYDTATNRMVVFGGLTAEGDSSIWVLKNATGLGGSPEWLRINPVGETLTRRDGHSVVYDPTTNRMILFGGAVHGSGGPFFQDVWILQHANGLGGTPEWIQLKPTGYLPTEREDHSAVYDVERNLMIMFGGWTIQEGVPIYFNDVWVLRNANGLGGTAAWEELKAHGKLPAKRELHTAVYNAAPTRMIVFGGAASATSMCNDTWVLPDV
jgi:hypothetical protein